MRKYLFIFIALLGGVLLMNNQDSPVEYTEDKTTNSLKKIEVRPRTQGIQPTPRNSENSPQIRLPDVQSRDSAPTDVVPVPRMDPMPAEVPQNALYDQQEPLAPNYDERPEDPPVEPIEPLNNEDYYDADDDFDNRGGEEIQNQPQITGGPVLEDGTIDQSGAEPQYYEPVLPGQDEYVPELINPAPSDGGMVPPENQEDY